MSEFDLADLPWRNTLDRRRSLWTRIVVLSSVVNTVLTVAWFLFLLSGQDAPGLLQASLLPAWLLVMLVCYRLLLGWVLSPVPVTVREVSRGHKKAQLFATVALGVLSVGQLLVRSEPLVGRVFAAVVIAVVGEVSFSLFFKYVQYLGVIGKTSQQNA